MAVEHRLEVPRIIVNLFLPHLNPRGDGVEVVEEGQHRVFQHAQLIAPPVDCGLEWMPVHNLPLTLVLKHIRGSQSVACGVVNDQVAHNLDAKGLLG